MNKFKKIFLCTIIISFCLVVITTIKVTYSTTLAEATCEPWAYNTFKIIFNSNGGSNVTAMRAKAKTDGQTVPMPSKKGYNFEGWYYDAQLTKKAPYNTAQMTIKANGTGTNICYDDVILYAKWEKGQIECPFITGTQLYKVSFNTNGGTSLNPLEIYNTVVGYPDLPTSTKNGYAFEGWYYDANLTNKAPFKPEYLKTTDKKDANGCKIGLNDLTLYAKWTMIEKPSCESWEKGTFKIVFSTNDGTSINAIRVKYKTKGQKLPFLARTGYLFDGWYYDAQFTKKVPSDTASIEPKPKNSKGVASEVSCFEDVHLYAKWVANTENNCIEPRSGTFMVSFYSSGGSFTQPIRVWTVSLDQALPSPTRNTYVFDGWYYDSAYTEKASSNTGGIKQIKKYDSYGCLIGWNDIMLYAKWKKSTATCPTISKTQTYKIMYNTNGGTKLNAIRVTYPFTGGPKLSIPTKKGYTFAGWYYDSQFTKKAPVNTDEIRTTVKADANGCEIGLNDLIVYAKWTNDKIGCTEPKTGTYKLLYFTNGGNEISGVRLPIPAENTTTKLPIPFKKGYTFAGWYLDSALTKKAPTYMEKISAPKVTDWNNCHTAWSDVKLYAKWTKQSTQCNEPAYGFFKLIYNSNGGNAISSVTLATNRQGGSELLTPKKNGYIFDGWYLDPALKTLAPTNTSKIESIRKYDSKKCLIGWEDVNVYAKWKTKNELTHCTSIKSDSFILTFNTNGGNAISEMNVSTVSVVGTELPTPTREGYKFSGWYYDSNYTKEAPFTVDEIVTVKEYDAKGCGKGLRTVTVYAKWLSETGECLKLTEGNFKLMFNANGGTPIDSITLSSDRVTGDELPIPVKKGYKFSGWYYDSNFTNKAPTNTVQIQTSKIIDSGGCEVGYKDVTVYARWYLADTAIVSGKLIDAYGNPLSNYLVELQSDITSTTTDENGEYRIENVKSGNHTLYVKNTEGQPIASSSISVVQDGYTNTEMSVYGFDETKPNIEIDLMLNELNEIDLLSEENKTNMLLYAIIIVLLVIIIVMFNAKTKKKPAIKNFYTNN